MLPWELGLGMNWPGRHTGSWESGKMGGVRERAVEQDPRGGGHKREWGTRKQGPATVVIPKGAPLASGRTVIAQAGIRGQAKAGRTWTWGCRNVGCLSASGDAFPTITVLKDRQL